MKIQDAFHSCKRFIELKHNHCKKMKNLISVLLWEISELKETKSELELKEAEWEQKFCSLRFTLKQEEEKRRNADMLYERTKEELRRKEAQYRKEVEVKQPEQTLKTQDMELRTVKKNLDEVNFSLLKCVGYSLISEEKARFVDEEYLAHRSENEKEVKKLIESKKLLQHNLDQEKKKNSKLEKRVTRIYFRNSKQSETLFKCMEKPENLKRILRSISLPPSLTNALEITSSKCLCLQTKNQALQQELLSMKTIQTKWEELPKNKQQVEQYTQEKEEKERLDTVENLKEANLQVKTQASSQNLEQLRHSHSASTSQLQCRIKDPKFALFKKKTQEDFNKIQLEKHKNFYLEELTHRRTLSNKLNKANKTLAEVKAKLLEGQEKSRSSSTTCTQGYPSIE
uniref:DUF3496 domain-containing protein n=1 Tax=Otolemur garnettii TaxID=30611 RepID=H0XTL6_OTOGA